MKKSLPPNADPFSLRLASMPSDPFSLKIQEALKCPEIAKWEQFRRESSKFSHFTRVGGDSLGEPISIEQEKRPRILNEKHLLEYLCSVADGVLTEKQIRQKAAEHFKKSSINERMWRLCWKNDQVQRRGRGRKPKRT